MSLILYSLMWFCSSFPQVHVQLSEWHRAIFLPQAWLAYMTRAYHAILQVRLPQGVCCVGELSPLITNFITLYIYCFKNFLSGADNTASKVPMRNKVQLHGGPSGRTVRSLGYLKAWMKFIDRSGGYPK